MDRYVLFLKNLSSYHSFFFTDTYRFAELTLNQALVSWIMERYLEKVGLAPRNQLEESFRHHELNPISKLCPGLPVLTRILSEYETLPHPGIKRISLKWCAKSTEVASLTLECVERAILASLYDKKRVEAQEIMGLEMIRLVRNEAIFVNMKHGEASKPFVSNSDNLMVLDEPTDSPQFVVVYGLSKEIEITRRVSLEKRTHSKNFPPFSSFLFQKVSIDDFLAKDIPGSLSNALKTVMLK